MEVLGLHVKDVDIGGRWVTVTGKGAKQRRVPLDPDVASVIDVYLLAERPESDSEFLFLVGKGPNRGGPLTAAGLRTVFRYHRGLTGVTGGHPHALRHTFGTVLAGGCQMVCVSGVHLEGEHHGDHGYQSGARGAQASAEGAR